MKIEVMMEWLIGTVFVALVCYYIIIAGGGG